MITSICIYGYGESTYCISCSEYCPNILGFIAFILIGKLNTQKLAKRHKNHLNTDKYWAVSENWHIFLYGYISSYCRSNAFEVLALDGVSTGILQFYTAQESADWLRAMSTNISDLTLQNVCYFLHIFLFMLL